MQERFGMVLSVARVKSVACLTASTVTSGRRTRCSDAAGLAAIVLRRLSTLVPSLIRTSKRWARSETDLALVTLSYRQSEADATLRWSSAPISKSAKGLWRRWRSGQRFLSRSVQCCRRKTVRGSRAAVTRSSSEVAERCHSDQNSPARDGAAVAEEVGPAYCVRPEHSDL